MTTFEMIGLGLNKLQLTPPVLNIDLDLADEGQAVFWEVTNFVGAAVLVCDDVAISLTGFWGKNAEMQITVSYTGAAKVGTVTFTSDADEEYEAELQLNLAIEKLLVAYLPAQGWQII